MKNTLLILLLILTGCITPGKVSSYLEKPQNKPEADVIVGTYTDKNPDFAAKLAAKYLKESTDTNTETTKGNTEAYQAKLAKAEARADSLLLALNNEPITPGCEPDIKSRDKVIASLQSDLRSARNAAANLKPDIQKQTITKYVENTARVQEIEVLLSAEQQAHFKTQAELQVLREDYKSTKGSLTRAYWFGGILVVAFAGLLFLLFRR